MAELKERANEFLQYTWTNVYKDFDKEVDQAKELHPETSIPCTKLGSFKVIQDGDLWTIVM